MLNHNRILLLLAIVLTNFNYQKDCLKFIIIEQINSSNCRL